MNFELSMFRAMVVDEANQIVEEVRTHQRENPQIQRLLLEAEQKGLVDGMKLERKAYEIAVRIALENWRLTSTERT